MCEKFFISKSSFIGLIAPVRIGDFLANRDSKSRLLGTMVDNKLSWRAHLLDVKKRFAMLASLKK